MAALGIVFGDIGTSPLYALRECFSPPHGVSLTEANILGVLSLVFWSLTLVVSIKYLLYVMRADNRGEGGVLALMALAQPHHALISGTAKQSLVFIGIFGAALLFGDGVITPAISVLSAMEGLNVATPLFEPYVIPATVAVLIGLFMIQSKGTGKIGSFFGPIILLWFLALGLLGVRALAQAPEVLGAISPLHALSFFQTNSWHGFLVLGSVFLVVTGGEALYADMGHFGSRPIRVAWFTIVLPGLLLNYFGQGALLLKDPSAISNPFYRLCPEGLLYPMIALATMATVIASQALISGAFSLTSQAIKLGLLPRMMIKHTSREEIGQIYVSRINWALLLCTLWLVLEFRTSSNLASAYGMAVSTTMVITTVLIYFVTQKLWKWNKLVSLTITGFFLIIELAFLGANAVKILDGGWVPLVMAGFVFTLMATWRRGRQILAERLREKLPPFDVFIHEIPEMTPLRVPGVAVYMNSHRDITPPALLYNLKHNKVVHELIIVAIVVVEEVPYVSPVRRLEVESLGREIYRVTIHYGFMDSQDIPRALALCKAHELDVDLSNATYFFGRESLLATPRPGMAIWRENLFSTMSQNAQKASRFFKIRADQVIEIGFEVEL
jgi:KUP system potassium uptake protein